MNTDHPGSPTSNPMQPHPDDEAAARLTALALGQLEGQERDDAEARLVRADAADLRQAVAETQRLSTALRVAREADLADAAGPSRSPDLRRAVIARLATPPSPAAQPESPAPRPATIRRAAWGLLAAAGSVAAAVLVAATMVLEQSAPFRGPERPAPRMNARPEPSANSLAAARDQRALARQAGQVDKASQDMIASEDVLAVEGLAVESRIAAAPPALAAGRSLPRAAQGPLAEDGPAFQELRREQLSREQYGRFAENPIRRVADAPLSTFGADVDTASYANIRRFLSGGRLPPRDAVRLEECVNYFRYDDALPEGDDPFAVTLESATCPWNEDRLLVRIGIRGRDIDRGRRPAGNLVFLIDVSGSMQSPDKLPLVKQALSLLVEELTENDRVAIVTYAGNAGLALPPTTGDQKATILAAIDRLTAGGSTHGSAGIALAYEQAAAEFIPEGANRVILATDGDLNVGVTSDAALVELIREKAAGGTFLTVLGFGQGNLQDEKMEKLADHGNGVYAYIDGVREARKVLVEQLTGSTITIAKDVKLQVEFNPARVVSYRLLGYENRLLAARDFRDDRKDAGDIGAGHTVTALYEVGLAGGHGGDISGAEPLKYQRQPEPEPIATDIVPSDDLLTVKLRFKQPDGNTSTLREYPLADAGERFENASADLRFAAAVAGFAMILRNSDHVGSLTLDDVARIASRSLGRDEGGYRAEFIDLVRKAAFLQPRRNSPAPR
jgi:Ca-activated chloride channel family protein